MEYTNKIIGMAMVIISTTAYGIILGRDIKARLKELKELKKIVFLMKGEIGFLHTPLLEALENVSFRCDEPFKEMLINFVKFGRESDRRPFSEIWEEGMNAGISKTHLSKEDKLLFMKFGNELGFSDIKTQQSAMDNFLNELDMSINQLEKIVPNKVKLYNSMGIMLGIVIAIIMI
jgi:stage III sporulation protein AB